MKIALFRPFRDTYRESMAIYADQLARGLRRRLGSQTTVQEVELPGARLEPGWLRHWDQYVRYQRLVHRHHADVCHVLDHGFGHLAYRLPPERTVVTFHDATVAKMSDIGWRTRLSLRYSLGGIARAARVIADSNAAREDFLALARYPPDRVSVVHPGVDPSFRPPVDRHKDRHAFGFDRPVVLHVGNTLPYMNVSRVIGAFDRLVSQQGVDARLVKVGEFTGDHRTLLERRGLSNRVRELGRVPLDALTKLYGAADVLIYPPLHAGFGLPPLEAMACGTPVVCSNRGSLPEVVGEAAWLTDADDEDALADGLARILTDAALRSSLRDRGFARAARFSWNATVEDVLDVYRSLDRA